ncbi:hypothetical protein B0H14DRAFT_3579293 [Mycena olivaceomarginata]|nr:hypothetical protein B0H14DRAFT_3579293 [Mycena olivaceomarginata]
MAFGAMGVKMRIKPFNSEALSRSQAATGPEERRKIVVHAVCPLPPPVLFPVRTLMISLHSCRIVDLAANCYGYYVLQKAPDCEEEVCWLILSELLRGDPATALVNKHVSHMWTLVHPTGAADLHGTAVFGEVPKSQWGSDCIQHVLEHRSEKYRQMALAHLLPGLLELARNEQGSKSVVNALKEGGQETFDRVVWRIARLAMIVDLALSLTGSQLIASVLPMVHLLSLNLHNLILRFVRRLTRTGALRFTTASADTLRGCKTGSKVI